jgi:sec-independent protein translocase protein TatB
MSPPVDFSLLNARAWRPKSNLGSVFGLTFEKLLVIGVLAVFLLGPERLPQAAAGLARLVRGIRNMASGAKERMRDEMGDDFDDVDWRKLDPRQYDPRRIIRDALLDSPPSTARVSSAATVAAGSAEKPRRPRPARAKAGAAPYDGEAT